jgi:hypothetical protein
MDLAQLNPDEGPRAIAAASLSYSLRNSGVTSGPAPSSHHSDGGGRSSAASQRLALHTCRRCAVQVGGDLTRRGALEPRAGAAGLAQLGPFPEGVQHDVLHHVVDVGLPPSACRTRWEIIGR